MASSPVIALVNDVMTMSRLDSAARASDTSIAFPTNELELKTTIEELDNRSVLLLIGLATTDMPWETLVPYCRSIADAGGATLRVVAFGPHMDLQLRQRAKDAGIQEVWANSRLMTDLPKLLQEYQ